MSRIYILYLHTVLILDGMSPKDVNDTVEGSFSIDKNVW